MKAIATPAMKGTVTPANKVTVTPAINSESRRGRVLRSALKNSALKNLAGNGGKGRGKPAKTKKKKISFSGLKPKRPASVSKEKLKELETKWPYPRNKAAAASSSGLTRSCSSKKRNRVTSGLPEVNSARGTLKKQKTLQSRKLIPVLDGWTMASPIGRSSRKRKRHAIASTKIESFESAEAVIFERIRRERAASVSCSSSPYRKPKKRKKPEMTPQKSHDLKKVIKAFTKLGTVPKISRSASLDSDNRLAILRRSNSTARKRRLKEVFDYDVKSQPSGTPARRKKIQSLIEQCTAERKARIRSSIRASGGTARKTRPHPHPQLLKTRPHPQLLRLNSHGN